MPPFEPYFPSLERLVREERAGEELSLLPTFETVASTGSFSGAARLHGISRSRVFERVRALEAIVGFPLYRARGRTIELTADGKQIATYASAVMQLHRQRWSLGREFRAVLACTPTMLGRVLGPAIAAFVAQGPHKIDVRTVTEKEAIDAVRDERADVAVVATLVDRLPSRVLLRRRPMVAALPGHPLLDRSPLRRDALATARLISAPEVKLRVEPCEIVASVDAAIELARAGAGVAIIEGFHRVPSALRTATILDAPETLLHLVHTTTLELEEGPSALRRAIVDHVR